MNVSRIIGITKVIAKAIEKKSPGSCSGIIKDLEKASNHPLVIKQRIDELKEFWNNHKGEFTFTESEINAISEEAKFDLSDPSKWDSFLGIMNVPETITGGVDTIVEVGNAVDAVNVTDTISSVGETIVEAGDAADGLESAGGIFGDLIEFIGDLFS